MNVFRANDLAGATLVMHSYGGVPGTLAWERLGDRVAHVVYLDAFAPVDDGATPLQYFWQRNQKLPYKIVDGMVPPPVGPRPGLVSQSLRTLTDDMSLRTGALPAGATRTYVWASRNRTPTGIVFRTVSEKLSRNPAWRVYTVPTSHNVMRDDPVVAAAIITSR